MNYELTMNYQLPTISYANRRNTPNSAATSNKPPILPRLSTNYNLFMQNEPNFSDDQMNVTVIYTKEYENNSNWTLGENEPKTNPIKANFKGKKMLMRKTINARRISLCYCAHKIEATEMF